MRIGIITYWESNDNYGQQLQCWALQQYLRNLGHAPFLIRFKRYKPLPWTPPPPTIFSRIKKIFKFFLIVPYLKHKKKEKEKKIKIKSEQEYQNWLTSKNQLRHFEEFRKENIISSNQEYASFEELKNSPPQADVYITGSDQVWNYNLTSPELAAYFLQFGDNKVKRIAYAPSIGDTKYPDHLLQTISQYLKRFDAISVRENASLNICKKAGYKAIKVCDPTILLHITDYNKLNKKSQIQSSYFYIYSLNYDSTNDLPWDSIKKYSTTNNKRIIVTPGSGFIPCKELFKNVEYNYATIPQWLTNIQNSDLFITASFHGIVFAILYHKRFLFTPLKGKYQNSNCRATELIELCNLNQLIWDGYSTIDKYTSIPINWESVDEAINILRDSSYKFLQNTLTI